MEAVTLLIALTVFFVVSGIRSDHRFSKKTDELQRWLLDGHCHSGRKK